MTVSDFPAGCHPPQIKICGLTVVAQAVECAALGVDALGCVFYPKSPRHVSDRRAAEICRALPRGVKTVGVFVDDAFATIMKKVERCRLSAVQLHGHESPDLVDALCRENLVVIKALFLSRTPLLKEADRYPEAAFIVEYGGGALPGGNARAWDWRRVAAFGNSHPLILAGGLNADTVGEAVLSCRPDAVDVSSGVESAAGQKDLSRVSAFVDAVRRAGRDLYPSAEKTIRIF